jgi:nitrogen fixation protein FixH
MIFLMNGIMMYWALSTHGGVVANEPYRNGLHYNDRIDADERQARLGWSDTTTVTRDGVVDVALVARTGEPIVGAQLTAQLGRPSTNRHDITLELREAAPGRYQARTSPLGEGNWVVVLEARHRRDLADPDYRMRRRLWLRP